MKPSRLFSAGWQAVMEGAGHWTLPAWAVLGPGRLAPRWLWVGSVDCAKRQESPGKKLLSEKKLKDGGVSIHCCAFCRKGILWTVAGCLYEEDAEATG